MNIRPSSQHDLKRLISLTIETFGPFYEDVFRPLVGEAVFRHQHGNWREDYHAQVSNLDHPTTNKYVAVAEHEGALTGYVAWNFDVGRKHGEIDILAVAAEQRRRGIGTNLCEHAFADVKARGVELPSGLAAILSTHPQGLCTRTLDAPRCRSQCSSSGSRPCHS